MRTFKTELEMSDNICRIGNNTDLCAYAYNKGGKVLASVFGKGYGSLNQVFSKLTDKHQSAVERIEIVNKTNNSIFKYKRKGSKFTKA